MDRPSRNPVGLGLAVSRRDFLRRSLQGVGAVGLGALGGPGLVTPARAAQGGADSFGPLQDPDTNGLKLPPGFSSRVVATSDQVVDGTSHTWHRAPDGGATFPASDGGWVYVSNAERGGGNGGVGALRFAPDGSLVDAYSVLSGTRINCAGGPTPWRTWLSCEERQAGRVYECDPFTPGSQGVVRAGLGTFRHEAAAVDAPRQQIYLTEDLPDGLLYRATPTAYPNLDAGLLEAAEILDLQGQGAIQPGQVRPLAWHAIAEPNPTSGGVQNASHLPLEERATRYQASTATPFDGGEGCWYEGGIVYFATKGDERVWRIDAAAQTIEIVYERATSSDPELANVDNLTVSRCGDVYVAEDPGDLRIVALTPSGDVKPIVQLVGVTGSEITGPALSPDATRLYFSSQRNPGRTYEVTGPFAPLQAVPAVSAAGRTLVAAALGAAAAVALRLRERRRGEGSGSDA